MKKWKKHLVPEGTGITLCGKMFFGNSMPEWTITSDPNRVTCKKCRKSLMTKCPKCNKAWDGRTLTRIEGVWTPTCQRCKTKLYAPVSAR